MLLLIDKPKGITSHDVVDKVRKVTGEKKVGHAGTLDPNATGLLVVGIGRDSTKKLGALSKDTNKTYEAEIFLGEERDTLDSEGKVTKKAKAIYPFRITDINNVLAKFLGAQKQIPPQHSAIKIKGKKAYQLARSGKKIELKPRNITIHNIELLFYDFPTLKIKVEVSSGTYIRSLARDIGKNLGCGAYLKELRRTKIGEFDISDAINLDNLKSVQYKK